MLVVESVCQNHNCFNWLKILTNFELKKLHILWIRNPVIYWPTNPDFT